MHEREEGGAARHLVLCFDGTNNNLTGGREDTNVAKLCRVLAHSESQQVYYDPGVGNPGTIPGATWQDQWRGKLQRLWGLAFGQGIYENIAEGYLHLMRHWRPGDRICVFGFSRGAFTARSVAGMVARFGILDRSMEGLVPTLLHLYFARPEDGRHKADYQAIVSQLGRDYCTPEGAKAEVWFVGVWDTVDSVGSPLSRRRIQATPTIVGKRFRHVRHALALDEHRRSFEPRMYYVHPSFDYAAAGQSIDQRWFSGAHCDVGGGYPDAHASLSDHSFLWLLQEAVGQGLALRDGLAPDGNVDTAAVLAAVRGSHANEDRAPRVHSEAFHEVYWALAGLGVRDFRDVQGDPGDPARGKPPDPPAAPPVEDPSVPALAKSLSPATDPWPVAQRRKQVALALAAGVMFWLLHAASISGRTLLEGVTLASPISTLADNLLRLAAANAELVRWQLVDAWRFGDAVGRLGLDLPHPLWMLAMDLGFIFCYGWFVALGLAHGFARAAGLSRAGRPHPAWLNALGWSGACIVGADLVEDGLLLLALAARWLDWILVQDLFAAAMALASAAKWLAVVPWMALASKALAPASPESEPLVDQDRPWAAAAHLSALLWLVVPFGHVAGPLAMAWVVRKRSAQVRQQARAALNFQLWGALAVILSYLVLVLFTGFVASSLVAIALLGLSVAAGVRAIRGKAFRYPLAPKSTTAPYAAAGFILALFAIAAAGMAAMDAGQVVFRPETRAAPTEAFSADQKVGDSDWLQYAELSRLVYAPDARCKLCKEPADYEGGWRWTSLARIENPSSGFYAQVFRYMDGTIALAFRGTEPDDWRDVLTDLAMGFGFRSRQFADAEEAFLRVREEHGRALRLTGHSLGGSLAQYLGAKYLSDYSGTGKWAVAFNGFGVSRLASGFTPTAPGLQDKVFNVTQEFDLVSSVSFPFTFGGIVADAWDFVQDRSSQHLGCKMSFPTEQAPWNVLRWHSVDQMHNDVYLFEFGSSDSTQIVKCPTPRPRIPWLRS